MTNKSAQELFDLPGCGHVRCYTEALACAIENFCDAHNDNSSYDTGDAAANLAVAEQWARLYIAEGVITCQAR